MKEDNLTGCPFFFIILISIIVFSICIPYCVIPEINKIRVYEGTSNISAEQLADAMPHMCVDCLTVVNTTSDCNVVVNYSFTSENDYPYLDSQPQKGGAKVGSYFVGLIIWGLVSILGSASLIFILLILGVLIESIVDWVRK